MSWLAVLLIGVACTDLVFSVRPARLLPECIGATAAVVTGLLAGLTDVADLVALVVIGLVVLAWGHTVTRGLGRGPAWLPLLVLGLAVTVAVLLAGLASPADGLVGRWVGDTPVPVASGLDPDRFLLLLGAFGLQLSTGNVLVRLVLAATGTLNPARHGLPDDPELQLKGGRLLGPMERVLILGLGLAGQLTAASIVIAAKGLLRFPELSSRREQTRIHQLTEYFLVGSFLSWLVALSALVLVA